MSFLMTMPVSPQDEFRIGTSLIVLVTAWITNGRYVRFLPSRNLAIAEKSASKNVTTWAEVWRLLSIRSAMVFRIGVNGRISSHPPFPSPSRGEEWVGVALGRADPPFAR